MEYKKAQATKLRHRDTIVPTSKGRAGILGELRRRLVAKQIPCATAFAYSWLSLEPRGRGEGAVLWPEVRETQLGNEAEPQYDPHAKLEAQRARSQLHDGDVNDPLITIRVTYDKMTGRVETHIEDGRISAQIVRVDVRVNEDWNAAAAVVTTLVVAWDPLRALLPLTKYTARAEETQSIRHGTSVIPRIIVLEI
jgi:hypothetical protein